MDWKTKVSTETFKPKTRNCNFNTKSPKFIVTFTGPLCKHQLMTKIQKIWKITQKIGDFRLVTASEDGHLTGYNLQFNRPCVNTNKLIFVNQGQQ